MASRITAELVKDYTLAHYVEHGQPYFITELAADLHVPHTTALGWASSNHVPGVQADSRHNPETAPKRMRRSLCLLPTLAALREFIHEECRPKHEEDF